jgi:hypothetical protein
MTSPLRRPHWNWAEMHTKEFHLIDSNSSKPPRPPRKPESPEAGAVRRIGRILDELDEEKRPRVVGAINSLYYGPVPK